jgi:hypothetical protein
MESETIGKVETGERQTGQDLTSRRGFDVSGVGGRNRLRHGGPRGALSNHSQNGGQGKGGAGTVWHQSVPRGNVHAVCLVTRWRACAFFPRKCALFLMTLGFPLAVCGPKMGRNVSDDGIAKSFQQRVSRKQPKILTLRRPTLTPDPSKSGIVHQTANAGGGQT